MVSNGFWGAGIALRAHLRPVWGKSDETKTGVHLGCVIPADGKAKNRARRRNKIPKRRMRFFFEMQRTSGALHLGYLLAFSQACRQEKGDGWVGEQVGIPE